MKTLPKITIADVERIIDGPFEDVRFNCHSVSLAIVKSGFFETSRVARGTSRGVSSQHSWVVVGDDCYAPDAVIVDATRWAYLEPARPEVWVGTAREHLHVPFGAGSIWDYGRPPAPSGDVIPLAVKLSVEAKAFMELAAPRGLDHTGWSTLAHSPVGGWPAAEIIGAMYDTPRLAAIVPIDIVGMLTDRNPQGLYR
jgi:hypothetical protein